MSARDLLDRLIDKTGLGTRALAHGRDKLRILCYHGIWDASGPHFGNKLFMSPEKFEARLALIASLGLQVLPMREALQALRAGRLPPKAAVITIDDGWATTFSHMLPALERFGYPATVYVQTERLEARAPVTDVALRYALENTSAAFLSLAGLPTLVPGADNDLDLSSSQKKEAAFDRIESLFASVPLAEHRGLLHTLFERLGLPAEALGRAKAFDLASEDELVEAERRGFEIALHTHTHALGDFSEASVKAEISMNRASLSRILGHPPQDFRHFCWPSGRYTSQAIAHLAATGVDIATTCDLELANERSHPLALPRILDGQLTSDEAFLVAVSGIQTWVDRASALVHRRRTEE
jgi:peptidoglycan/xylan/chitin deacetylase (PgdA/CDA1 family)